MIRFKKRKVESDKLEKTLTMLEKCAIAIGLRRAFPTELSGLYVAEEINSINIDEVPKEKILNVEAEVIEQEPIVITKKDARTV